MLPVTLPASGHAKADHRMDRCWLQGAQGDALHALSCALGYIIRWLMQALQALDGVIVALTAVAAAAERVWHRPGWWPRRAALGGGLAIAG